METKWYRFHQAVTVTNPANLAEQVDIDAGDWPVNFDDVVSSSGNAPECEVLEPNVRTTRIFRTDLIRLCEEGRVSPV